MAEDIPERYQEAGKAIVTEVRRVIIEMDFKTPPWTPNKSPMTGVDPALVRAVRDELIKMGARNSDIFGGRA